MTSDRPLHLPPGGFQSESDTWGSVTGPNGELLGQTAFQSESDTWGSVTLPMGVPLPPGAVSIRIGYLGVGDPVVTVTINVDESFNPNRIPGGR